MTQLILSSDERLKRYRRHADDAYAKSRASDNRDKREMYTRMAESWNRLAHVLENHMKRQGGTDS